MYDFVWVLCKLLIFVIISCNFVNILNHQHHFISFLCLSCLYSRYALYVRDNENLENLFRPEVERELVIKRGKVFFHGNRRLCQHKIRQLMNYTNLNISAHTDRDISRSNGDRIPCKCYYFFFFFSVCNIEFI